MVLDYESSYDELLRLSDSCAINVRLKRNLCEEWLEPQFYVRDFSDPQNQMSSSWKVQDKFRNTKGKSGIVWYLESKILWTQDLELFPIWHEISEKFIMF